MKVIKNLFQASALIVLLVAFASSHISEEKAEYECGNKFYRYKKAYIGLNIFADSAYEINQLQLDPPGIMAYNAGEPAWFSNNTKKIWYLYNNPHHEYEWVDSQNGEIPPFAIEVGKDRSGFSTLIGRIKKSNGFLTIGDVIPIANLMFYVDENNIAKTTPFAYQVLTYETKYPTPYYKFPPNKDSDTGCIHNWQLYKNDDAPVTNGIAVGEYDCNNTAYVGKGKDSNVTIPGQIQIFPQSGLILSNSGKSKLITNGC